MQQKRNATVGPRGWAMLTLIAGAALASPFLRTPRIDVGGVAPDFSTGGPLPIGPGQLAASDWISRQHQSRPAKDRTAPVSSGDALEWSELTPAANSASGAAAPQLPSWASPPSPLDQLIAQGTAPPWQGESRRDDGLQPLQAWVGETAQSPVPSPIQAARSATVWPPATVPNLAPYPGDKMPASPAFTSPSTEGLAGGKDRDAAGRSPGALAGTTLRSDNRAGPSAPSSPQFVYQPGYHGPAAN